MKENNIPIVDCPYGDYMIGDASGKLMNEYGRYPCKIKCGVYALLVRGTAHATINVTEYDFKANDVLLLEPGSFLLIREFSEDALVYWIVFGSTFLEKYTVNNRMSLSALQLHSPKLSMDLARSKIPFPSKVCLIKSTTLAHGLEKTQWGKSLRWQSWH